MMFKDKIKFLNGVTSAGKTFIVEAIQERENVFFYVVFNDLLQELVGDRYLQKDYWEYLGELIIFLKNTCNLLLHVLNSYCCENEMVLCYEEY